MQQVDGKMESNAWVLLLKETMIQVKHLNTVFTNCLHYFKNVAVLGWVTCTPPSFLGEYILLQTAMHSVGHDS